ncbi:hypothetical protein UFOVP255_42 [uncultured Caudovirales phage]|uniref:Uncharacterized protein n=1 Tax=uncultured Caudovirales phage TaxID=2100421 RepID=A0A6J5LHB6_9CAUD|nr:hypothetical protein UFOVP255_42 [uncultured Caudovirales phage]
MNDPERDPADGSASGVAVPPREIVAKEMVVAATFPCRRAGSIPSEKLLHAGMNVTPVAVEHETGIPVTVVFPVPVVRDHARLNQAIAKFPKDV